MNPIKFILCLIFAPEFAKRIPPDCNGSFVSIVYTESFVGHRIIRCEKKFKSRKLAYYWARWEALKFDWSYPKYEGVMIGWRVMGKILDAR